VDRLSDSVCATPRQPKEPVSQLVEVFLYSGLDSSFRGGMDRLSDSGEQRQGNQKNAFPNTTSRMDVRKARMSLSGEKGNKNERKLERELLWHFLNGSN
jgi:hypothetical protein